MNKRFHILYIGNKSIDKLLIAKQYKNSGVYFLCQHGLAF